MDIQLLVTRSYASCLQAEAVWRDVARESGATFRVIDIADPEGLILADEYALTTLPAVIIDGQLRAIGVQDHEEAKLLLLSK